MRAQHGTVDQTSEFDHMLAEKFFLFLESLKRSQAYSQTYSDGSVRIASSSPHVPVKLPEQTSSKT
jgi:hypothetical protein